MLPLRFLVLMALLICGLCCLAQAETKDPDPPSGQSVPPRAIGGPDAFGYTWENSVPFFFMDISKTGKLVFSGDDVSGVATLAEPFEIYGRSYDTLTMASNGYISTDPTDMGPDLSNDCPLPAMPSTGGGARLYPLHDDFICDGYYQWFESCPRPPDVGNNFGCHVFQWHDVNHFGGGGPFTIWTILYDRLWQVVYQVSAGNPENGSGSTTGLQNETATIGLVFTCNTAGSVVDNSAVTFYPPFCECCGIDLILLEDFTLTLYGDCDQLDVWAEDLEGNYSLVASNLNLYGPLTLDVSDYPDSVFFTLYTGGVPGQDAPISGVVSARTVPTLGQWGLIFHHCFKCGRFSFSRRPQGVKVRASSKDLGGPSWHI